MGLTSPDYIQMPREEDYATITWNYDGDEVYPSGAWQQFVYNDHVRIIIEKVCYRHYCVRGLIRSALLFEAIEELNRDPWWEGRIFYRDLQNHTLNCIARTEDLGESGFRQRYRELGGRARW